MDLLLTDPFIGDKSTDIKRQRSLKYGDFIENYNKKISKIFGFMVVAGYDVSFVDKINKVLTEEYKKIRPKNDILGNDGLCVIHSVKSDTGEEKDIVIVGSSSAVKIIYREFDLTPQKIILPRSTKKAST